MGNPEHRPTSQILGRCIKPLLRSWPPKAARTLTTMIKPPQTLKRRNSVTWKATPYLKARFAYTRDPGAWRMTYRPKKPRTRAIAPHSRPAIAGRWSPARKREGRERWPKSLRTKAAEQRITPPHRSPPRAGAEQCGATSLVAATPLPPAVTNITDTTDTHSVRQLRGHLELR